MNLSDEYVRQAEDRLQRRLDTEPQATAAQFDRSRNRIIVTLSNRLEISVPVDLIQGLASASAADLATIEISPTGLGLHWPALDADLYLPGLLQGVFGNRRWMTRQMGPAAVQAKGNA